MTTRRDFLRAIGWAAAAVLAGAPIAHAWAAAIERAQRERLIHEQLRQQARMWYAAMCYRIPAYSWIELTDAVPGSTVHEIVSSVGIPEWRAGYDLYGGRA